MSASDLPVVAPRIGQHLARGDWLWLLLDYDGTLADFAPTPDHVDPDPVVIRLVEALARRPRIQVAVISGRRLSHVRKLIPVSGVHLAGTYGLEIQTAGGDRIELLDFAETRHVLDALKPRLQALLSVRSGFYLEDKGWALAIHARFAEGDEAHEVLSRAEKLMKDAAPMNEFRLLGGRKFLEICPRIASKGRTVTYLLDMEPGLKALPVYIGDDDKDEEAFEVIRSRGGLAILVANHPRPTHAIYRLDSPEEVHRLIVAILVHLC